MERFKILGEVYCESDFSKDEWLEIKQWYADTKNNFTNIEELYEDEAVIPENAWMFKRCDEYNPELVSKNTKALQAYIYMHPFGHMLSSGDTARLMETSTSQIYRWLKELKAENPKTYDLDKFPTRMQLEAWLLIHPEFGGLTQREAAKQLGITYTKIKERLARMRKTHPEAFSFERMGPVKHFTYNPNMDDDQIKEQF